MISYVSEQTLCQMYGYAAGTVCRHIGKMRQIQMYDGSIIGCGRGTRVDPGAYEHYLHNRAMLDDPAGKKFVRPYQREEV